MKTKLILFGLGEIGEIMHFYISHDCPSYEVIAFTVNREFMPANEFCGLPVVAFEEVEKHYPPQSHEMLIAIGYSKVNKIREMKFNEAKAKGYKLATWVSSKATTWPGLKVGENSIIFEDNTIQPFTKIGNNVIMWSGNHLGHHSEIGDHCFIASHVVISGGVRVENNCFIGVNATLRDHVKIGHSSVIGMGVSVLDSVPPNSVLKAVKSESIPVTSDRIKL